MSTAYATWCSCAPGLEPLLAAELTALGLKPKEIEPGGMTVSMRAEQLYAANLHTSVASRITSAARPVLSPPGSSRGGPISSSRKSR